MSVPSRPTAPPRLAYVATRPSEVDADLLVVPCLEADELIDVRERDASLAHAVQALWRTTEFRASVCDLVIATVENASIRARRIALAGAGPGQDLSPLRVAQVASAVTLAARARGFKHVAFFIRDWMGGGREIEATAEGLTTGAFVAGTHKSRAGQLPPHAMTLVGSHDRATSVDACARGELLGRCRNLARDLVNEPPNVLTPPALADVAVGVGAESGLEVDVLDERALSRLEMGLLLGVAKGSALPPRLIVLKYHPPATTANARVLALVGKGVTFDGGGLSAKRGPDLEFMKYDMAGGAAVICAMSAIGRLRPAVPVIGVVAAAENLPGANAMRPGDVLKSAAGLTVEIINPDAEGRLILADALWYACRLGATHLVDIATLTGSCIAMLGECAAGLCGAPAAWVRHVRAVADAAGEPVWPLPLFDDYRAPLHSQLADLANATGRTAGAMTAALFLREFTGGLPWAQLDIAGTAWSDAQTPYRVPGPTGAGVRTLVDLALTMPALVAERDAWLAPSVAPVP